MTRLLCLILAVIPSLAMADDAFKDPIMQRRYDMCIESSSDYCAKNPKWCSMYKEGCYKRATVPVCDEDTNTKTCYYYPNKFFDVEKNK